MHATPLRLVYIHSGTRKDERFRGTLEKHLARYRRAKIIEDWHSGLIKAGETPEVEAAERLNEADIVLLLISVDFLNSSFAYDLQMNIALKREQAGQARVIPIMLRECDTSGTPFTYLAALPKDGEPVDQHKNQDAVFTDIVLAIGAVVEEIRKAAPAQIALPPKKPVIPEDVLLLCDREPQQNRVELVLEKKDLSRRPLVLVIHGGSDECLVEYKDRLKSISLPEFLGSQLPLEEYPVTLPGADIGREYFPSIFQKNLAGCFTNRSTPLNDLAEIISKNPARVLVYSRLYSNEWDPQGMEQTDAFFTFWNNFPALMPGHRLICCLLITHKSDSPADVKNADRAREFLKNLENQENLLNYKNRQGVSLDNLYAIVLPELVSVAEPDVVNWVEARHFRRICAVHEPRLCNINDAVAEIEERFRSAPEPRRIPMKKLLPQLEEIVSDYMCKGS